MSSIDNRIVEMQFNNSRFESNAKTTMSTLDKLKEKLNFSKASKELKEFQNDSDSFSLDRMASTIDKIGDKFTLLGQIGMNAMNRIASAAVDAGVSLLKSISVDQVSAGWSKYEQETNTVAALYAAVKSKGKSLDDVYEVLDAMAEYSDLTSYSYSQMSDAISKFVSAGQDMSKSEVAIEGIANAAALAGVSIGDASRAFTNFSDAMGKGYFQLADWKSIQLIHMDTENFKQTVLDTAKELGKLDDQYRVIGEESKGAVDTANFTEYLRYGFFDREVIMKTMEKYADRTTEFGKEAFEAAQKARTFTDVLDSVKDAASTGWKNSFKLIFGDMEEATELFSGMADPIIAVVQDIDNFRNSVLQGWRDLGGRDSIIGAVSNIWDSFEDLRTEFSRSWNQVFTAQGLRDMSNGVFNLVDESATYQSTGFGLAQFSKQFEQLTKHWNEWLNEKPKDGIAPINNIRRAFNGLLSIVDIVRQAIGGVFSFFGNIFKQLEPTIAAVLELFGEIGTTIFGVDKDLRKTNGITDFFTRLAKAFEPITSRLPGIVKNFTNFVKRIKETIKTNPKIKAFTGRMKNLFNAILDGLPKAVEGLIQFGSKILETVKNSDEWKALEKNFNKYIKPLAEDAFEFSGMFGQALADFINMDTSDEDTLWGKIKKRFSAFDQLGPWIQEKWNNLKEQIPWLQDVEDWWNTSPFIAGMQEWINAISTAIDKFFSEDTSDETSLVGKLEKRFQAMWDSLGPWLESKWAEYKEKWPILQQIEDFLKPLFGWGQEAEAAAQEGEEGAEQTIGIVQQIWDKVVEFVGKIDFGKLAMFGLAIGVLAKVYKQIRSLFGWASIGENIADAIEEVGGFIKEARKSMKKNNMLANVTAILEVAASIWLLGDTLAKVSQLSWEEIGRGLTAMAGLFVEEGAFMVVMSKFNTGKGKMKPLQMIGLAASMYILGLTLKSVAELTWEEIGRGLTAMAGLFVEEGAFMILVNRFGSTGLFEKKGTSATGMLSTAKSIQMLANTLKDLSAMTWEEIGRGLTAMAGLFVEEGAFMILINRLSKGRSVSAISMLSTAGSIMLLAGKMKELADMSWEEIGRGLTAMAGLFVEEGAFMVVIGFLSKKHAIDPNAVNATTGILAGGIGMMGDAMAKLGKLSWDEILHGAAALGSIEVILGLFVGLMGKFKTVKITSAVGMVAVAGSIWILVQAFMPLTGISWDQYAVGIAALGSVMVVLGLFCGVMSKMKMSIKTTLSVIVGAIALAALMVAFAFALTLIKDVDVGQILAFGAAMILVSGAMAILSETLQIFSKMDLGTAVKGTAIMVIAAAGLAAAVALILAIVGQSIQDFSNNIAVVGANLSQYSEMVEGINMEAVQNSVTMIKDLSAAFVEVGSKDYGNFESFKTNVTRMGSSLRLFGRNTAEFDTEKAKSIAGALKSMATDLSGLSEVSDISTTVGNIGGAIKLYAESLSGVSLDSAPDSTAIQQVFDTLKGALPDEGDMAEVAGYAAEGKGDEMTNFAIGLTNIATAVSSFSDNTKDLDFTNITKATEALSAIASLDTGLKTTSVSSFGPFASSITEEKMPLSTFAEDIVALGTALNDFGTNISKVNTDNLKTGTTVLKEVVKVNKALPRTGGISSWINGTQSLTTFAANLKLLGAGAKEFGTAVSGSTFDAASVSAAGDALIKIAEVNDKLPETGGISSWFTGDKSLGSFSANLKDLGAGIKRFVDEFGDSTITDNIPNAIEQVSSLADIQIKLSESSNWYNLEALASDLNSMAGFMNNFNNTLSAITWASEDNLNSLKSILDWAVENQVKLGATKYSKNLKDIGTGIKEFINEVGSVNDGWFGSNEGKLERITGAISTAFDSINTTYDHINDKGETKSIADIVKTMLDDSATEMTDRQDAFVTSGQNLMAAIGTGASDNASKVIDAVTNACSRSIATVRKYRSKFAYAGEMIPAGLAEGIYSNQSAVLNAVGVVCEKALANSKNVFAIKSPSKKFEEIGMYSDLGLANGFLNYADTVDNAAAEVSQGALASVFDNLKAITDLPLDVINIQPTIRPIFDMTNVNGNAAIISGMFGGSRSIGFNTKQIEAQAQLINDDYVLSLDSINQNVIAMNERLDNLSETIQNMRIVMNTGALVGALESGIDKRMGARARLGERWN